MEATRVGSFDNEMYNEMKDKLIYENDIPTKAEADYHLVRCLSKSHKKWDPEIVVTDNRMEWNLKRKGLNGATMDWAGNVVMSYKEGHILPKIVDRMVNSEFYNGNEWPTCPITGKEIPIV